MAEDGILTQTHQPKAAPAPRTAPPLAPLEPKGEFKSAPYSLAHHANTGQPRTGVGPEQKD